jgi:hypothetical protein
VAREVKKRRAAAVPAERPVDAWTVSWQAILDAHRLAERPAGGKTVAEFAAELGKGVEQTRRLLQRLVEEGQLKAVLCNVRGRQATVYVPV